jgi:hypothetical protein
MSAFNRRASALAALLLSLGSLSVFAQEGTIMLTINNNTSGPLLVTVYDMAASPRAQLLANRAIYGNASVTVSVMQDASGKGHVRWTAMNQDPDMRMCGHDDKTDLNDGDTVNVYADGDCSG